MSLVTDLNIPPENYDAFTKACVVRDHFSGTRIDKKNVVWRKRNFTSLIARSPFQSLASLWDSLTITQQDDWDSAGSWAGISGWDLFVQDTLYRIQNSLVGFAIPSDYHQYLVGEVKVEAPAEEIEIMQTYFGNHPVPVDWYFNWISDLTSTGAGSFATIVVTVNFQNWNGDFWENISWEYDYDLTADTGWVYYGDEFNETDILIISVVFDLHIYKMRGVVYIDGVEFDYSDTNYAVDSQCNDFANSWQSLKLPVGASYKSVYCPDEYN